MAAGGKAPINVKSRLLEFGVFLFVWALLIVARLILLQVLHYGEWVQRAQRQQQRTVEISPQRGIIYDRNGQELAMTVQVDSVFAVPSEIPDQKNTATSAGESDWRRSRQCAGAHAGAEETLPGSHARWMAKPLRAFKSLDLRGIYFQKELKRFYPKRRWPRRCSATWAWKTPGWPESSIFTRAS